VQLSVLTLLRSSGSKVSSSSNSAILAITHDEEPHKILSIRSERKGESVVRGSLTVDQVKWRGTQAGCWKAAGTNRARRKKRSLLAALYQSTLLPHPRPPSPPASKRISLQSSKFLLALALGPSSPPAVPHARKPTTSARLCHPKDHCNLTPRFQVIQRSVQRTVTRSTTPHLLRFLQTMPKTRRCTPVPMAYPAGLVVALPLSTPKNRTRTPSVARKPSSARPGTLSAPLSNPAASRTSRATSAKLQTPSSLTTVCEMLTMKSRYNSLV